ncbi:hypothetical protein SERLA73DRAFT_155325 [Serpula lacrymans var. lacrymans S7.3]|uniref:Uncharacterized protein n=1 Tax=Serpula lacrymans var. lacrymans (strain S7.3) TaxID=936435 RepID=F8Q9D8_SERL3|nr:hypothetical protein SERLA73DRAFT_155325 [Serpula lacrymans var. lacrymans S7.3]
MERSEAYEYYKENKVQHMDATIMLYETFEECPMFIETFAKILATWQMLGYQLQLLGKHGVNIGCARRLKRKEYCLTAAGQFRSTNKPSTGQGFTRCHFNKTTMNSALQKQLSDIVKTIRLIPFDATVEAVKNKPSDVEAKALFWQQEGLLSQEFNKAEALMPKVCEMPLYKAFMKKVEYVREMETKEDDAMVD